MSDFMVLNDEQHLLLRPNMYIGNLSESSVNHYYYNGTTMDYKSTKIVPGLDKIINEIIDNSVDEHIRTDGKFSNNIDVIITNNPFTITVKDSGRGIAVKYNEQLNEYQPISAWTRSRSGSSFSETRVSLGLNGIGSMATYCFSKTFKGETHDGKNGLVFEKRDNVRVFPSKKQGTTVTFSPDFSLLKIDFNDELYDNHCEFIKQRLINLSLCYPKIKFTFNGENVSFKSIDLFANAVSENNIIYKSDKFSIIIASTAEVQEFRFHNYTNGLYNINGGSVVDYVCSQLCAAIIPLIKRKHKIDVTSGQIKNNLFIGVFATGFVNLKFDSQTKERVTNSVKEVAEYFSYDFSALAKKVMANDDIIDPIVKAILFKKAQAENLALAREQKKLKNDKVLNHIPATFSKREECSLLIVEGQSAQGYFGQTRENNKLGMFSLQGKIDNVSKLTPNQIIDVKVLKELMTVTSLKLNSKPVDLNYGKIILAADADVDGSAICLLLINFFALWGEEIFDKIYRILPPLYKVYKKGQKSIYYYSQEEFDNEYIKLKGYSFKFYKGLGSLDEKAFGDMINNPKLIKINWDENSVRYLDMAFGKDEQKRKDWLLTGKFK